MEDGWDGEGYGAGAGHRGGGWQFVSNGLTISGDRMFFGANDGPAGAELWSMPGFVQNASGRPFSFFQNAS